MPTLGAQIISDNPVRMLSTIVWLRSLKLFDEVIAVADIDKGNDIIESATFADRYTTLSFEHQEEAIDTAINMSTTDWMFRIDDDELMGSNFISGVRKLVENPTHDSYWFPRMWLYKDSRHFIASSPNYPDHQIRLFKKGSLRATKGTHMHPTTIGTSSTISFHIFHYLLLDTTYEERVEKCKNYARLMGISIDDFLAGFGKFYLPEKYDDLDIKEIVEELWKE
jgi:hypothetical protein